MIELSLDMIASRLLKVCHLNETHKQLPPMNWDKDHDKLSWPK